ncbi:NnrS family protein [bacterium]|nr:NnrS family protein [bacterium]
MFAILKAPHRIFFALGAVLLIVPILWWTAILSNFLSLGSTVAVYSPGAHMHFMCYGALSAFILGFILTVFPKWLNFPSYDLKHIYALMSLFIGGFAFMIYGVLYEAKFHSIGAVLNAGVFVYLSILLANSLYKSSHAQKMQPAFALLGVFGGAVGSISYALFMFQHGFFYYELSYALGIYFYLFIVVAAVAFRMIPFFTSCVIKGYEMDRVVWFLPMISMGSILKVLLFVYHLPQYYFLADGFILFAVLVQFKHWKFKFNQGIPLLDMLYYSMFWMPFSLLLSCIYSLTTLVSGMPLVFVEEAALHSLTIGCYSSLVYAMATRVTLGHSGQKLQTTKLINITFYIFQLCVIARVGMGIYAYIDPMIAIKSYMSGYIWLLCFGIWFLKYFPVYFVKRVDGKEG